MASWEDDFDEAPPPGLNRNLLLVKQLEGSGRNATSPKGARGRYQIMPDTARRYGFDPGRLDDEAYSQRVASAILDDNDRRGGGRIDDALVLYNASPKAYQRWVKAGRDPAALPAETRNYLARAEKLHGGPLHAASWEEAYPEADKAPAATWEAAYPVVGDDSKNRLGRAVGGMIEEKAGRMVKGWGEWLDAATHAALKQTGETGQWVDPSSGVAIRVSPQQQKDAALAAQRRDPAAQLVTAPAASKLITQGEKMSPKNRTPVESFVRGAVGFGLPLATAFIPEVGPAAAGASFGGLGVEQTKREAQAKGASPEAAETAALASGAIQGVIGMTPAGEMARAAVPAIKGVGGVVARIGAAAAGEGTLNAGLQVGENVVAQQYYDPNRPWYDQTPEAFAVGAAVGLPLHAVGEAMHGVKARLRPAEAPAEVDAEGKVVAPVAPESRPLHPDDVPETNALNAYAARIGDQDPALGTAVEHRPLGGETMPGVVVGHDAENREVRIEGENGVTVSVPLDEVAKAPPKGAPVIGVDESGVKVAGRAAGFDADGNALVESAGQIVPVSPGNIHALPAAYESARHAFGAPLEQMPQAIEDVRELRKAAPKDDDLFKAIKRLGGVRSVEPDGRPNDVAEILQPDETGKRRIPPGLINNKTGLTPDQMREALQGHDWFGQAGDGPRKGDHVDDLYELMRQQASGARVYHPFEDQGGRERRADLEDQMGRAGVAAGDKPPVAAAKLAAWRAEEVKRRAPAMDDLMARAGELGVAVRKGATRDEIQADVLEREAILAADDVLPPEGYEELVADEIERAFDPEQRYELAVLAADEHDWLAHPDRGSRGAAGEDEGHADLGPGPEGLGPGARADGAPHPRDEGAGADQEGADQAARGLGLSTSTFERQDIGHETVEQNLLAGAGGRERGPLRPKVAQEGLGELFGEPRAEARPSGPATTTADLFAAEAAAPEAAELFDISEGNGRGKATFVAKPKGLTAVQARALLPLAQRHGGAFDVAGGFRFPTSAQRAAFLAEAVTPGEASFQKDPIFYSAVERHVAQSPMKAAPAAQWKATLANAPGIKREELEWTGVNDWLDLFDKGEKVPKEKVEAFLRDNGVRVHEEVLGGPTRDELSPASEVVARHKDEWDALTGQIRVLQEIERRNLTREQYQELERLEDLRDRLHSRMMDESVVEGLIQPSYAATQFSDWKLPGGDNYRELLLTLPKEANPPATHWDTPGVLAHARFTERLDPDGAKVLFVEEIQSDWMQKGRDQGFAQKPDPIVIQLRQEQFDAAIAELNQLAAPFLDAVRKYVDEAFRREQPEYARLKTEHAKLASDAMNGRGDANALYERQRDIEKQMDDMLSVVSSYAEVGKKLKESSGNIERDVQTALAGRFWRGAALPAREEAMRGLRELRAEVSQAQLHVNEIKQALDRAKSPEGIPDAPFKSSWPALVMKRMIRYAVDHGFERLAWTTGEQQGERYSLTKHVGRVTFDDNAAGGIGRAKMEGETTGGTLTVRDPEGRVVMERHIGARGTSVEAEMREIIGADLTGRLLAAPPTETRGGHGWNQRTRHLEGLDVKIGDDGMRAFYDRNLVNITNDLIKKYGGKVDRGAIRLTYMPASEYEKYPEDHPYRQKNQPTVHGFDLTPKLAEAASGGFPLFRREVGKSGERIASTKSGGESFRVAKNLELIRKGDVDATTQALADRVEAEVRRLAPHAQVEPVAAMRDVRDAPGAPRAFGATWRDGLHTIVAWASEGNVDAVGTARHEAVHALKMAGLFRTEEWESLSHAAVAEDWIGRHNLGDRYAELADPAQREKLIEEAIAEEFANWRRRPESQFPGLIRTAFEKMRAVLDAVIDLVHRIRGLSPTAADVMGRIERGEVGRRLGREEPTLDQLHDVDVSGLFDPATFQKRKPEEETRPTTRAVKLNPIDKILGRGVDAVGARMLRTIEKVMPDGLGDIIEDVQLGISPMAAGSPRAQADAKTFANSLRAIQNDWTRVSTWLTERFESEQRRRMWEAADEHGVLLRRGVAPGPGQGLNRLNELERRTVLTLQLKANEAYEMAKARGMATGEGLESYVPRMVAEMTMSGARILQRPSRRQLKRGAGGKLITTTGQMRHRKYETVEETEAAARQAFGDKVFVVRDIAALAKATARLEQAVAGRMLVDRIKRTSLDAMAPLVVEGAKPSDDFFTLDHPALQKWGPKLVVNEQTGKREAVIDQNGDPVFEPTPLWISREFEGPLKAVLQDGAPTHKLTRAYLGFKGKLMGVIMYNPLLHNAVIWGKSAAADPLHILPLVAYWKGHALKKDPATMREALEAGLDPVGRRFMQGGEIGANGLIGDDGLVPGRSWTSQVLAYIPGLLNPQAGEAVKIAVDKAGHHWHNTFLWDRVADLQMHLYGIMRDSFSKHIPADAAQKLAAHYANRYAGSLPMEGMSKAARLFANGLLFSRSFTLTNMGAFKDLIRGMPSDIRAQIEREHGKLVLDKAVSLGRRKAIALMAMDLILSRVGLMLAAGLTAWVSQNPVQWPWQNEQGLEDRFLVNYQTDGTVVYGRLPFGKAPEEWVDVIDDPRELLLRKLSPVIRLLYAMGANDKGYGQTLYDDSQEGKSLGGRAENVGKVVEYFVEGILPENQLQGLHDVVTGEGDTRTAALQAFLPLTGITVRKGAPGGAAAGALLNAEAHQRYREQQATPDIRRDIRAGRMDDAKAKMAELGMSPSHQRSIIRTTIDPASRLSARRLRDFNRFATPEQQARMAKARAAARERAAAEEP